MKPRKDEIDRMFLMLYHSRNSGGCVNFTRPAGWLDKLPMIGLDELSAMFAHFKSEVDQEVKQRSADGMPKYSRDWYESQEAERKAGADLLLKIGVHSGEPET